MAWLILIAAIVVGLLLLATGVSKTLQRERGSAWQVIVGLVLVVLAVIAAAALRR